MLLGLAANMDNVSVGFAYGVKRRRIGWWPNLLIAVITTAITLIAFAGGTAIRRALPPELPNFLGGGMLLMLAAWNFWADRESAGASAFDALQRFASRPRVGILETLFLAMTLSINNIGLVIAGGVGGIGYEAMAFSICGFSIVTLAVGQRLGSDIIRSKLSRATRFRLSGNVVLALAGLLMLAGV